MLCMESYICMGLKGISLITLYPFSGVPFLKHHAINLKKHG